jgi:hypothetical protein
MLFDLLMCMPFDACSQGTCASAARTGPSTDHPRSAIPHAAARPCASVDLHRHPDGTPSASVDGSRIRGVWLDYGDAVSPKSADTMRTCASWRDLRAVFSVPPQRFDAQGWFFGTIRHAPGV